MLFIAVETLLALFASGLIDFFWPVSDVFFPRTFVFIFIPIFSLHSYYYLPVIVTLLLSICPSLILSSSLQSSSSVSFNFKTLAHLSFFLFLFFNLPGDHPDFKSIDVMSQKPV